MPPRLPLQGALFAAGCAAAALCIDFSRYHEMQHADALLPVMVSLYKWDLFYWGQSRLGMLLPALAAPFEHPFWNLIVQNGLGIFGALAVMGCVAWYLLRDRSWAAVGSLGAVVFLLAFPEGERFHLMNGSQPYAIPLGLALLSIAMVAGRGRTVLRWTAAAVLTAVAYWVHFGIGTQIAMLAGGRFLYERLYTAGEPDSGATTTVARLWNSRGVREFAFATVLTGFGTAVGAYLMSLSPYPQPHMGTTHTSLWVHGWTSLLAGIAGRSGGLFHALAAGMALGLLWLALPGTRAAAARAWVLLGVCGVWLGLQVAMAGTLQWVNFNDYDIRYLYPGLIALAPAAAVVGVGPLLARFPRACLPLTALLAAALPLAAVLAYGPPSVAAARAALDRSTGHFTKDLLEANCTHVVGDYWPVWAATFHANMTLADRRDPRTLWAVTFRAAETSCYWGHMPPHALRLGYVGAAGGPPHGRPPVMHWGWAFEDLIEVEHHGAITVYKAK